MLPAVLSDEACSLAPGVERLAVTAEIELGAGAGVGSARFYRSVIRSDARLDYDRLDRVFAGAEAAPEQVAEPLRIAREAAAGLGEARAANELAVSTSEPEFEFDEAGDVVAARGVEQTEAHRLIERLMILANEQVASLLERRRVPTLYRVHEQPDPQRVEYMVSQLASLDLPTPPLPERMGPRGPARRAASWRPRRRGAATGVRRIHRSCSAP
jgi:ribonuclease R